MEQNPYESPVHQSPPDRNLTDFPKTFWRQPWLVWAALAWLAFLFLYVPAPNINRAPAGAFLSFKIVTTGISVIAVASLVFIPRGWGKLATIPFAAILVFVQTIVWLHFP